MATSELDPILKYGLKLLHSNDNTSAEKIRIKIDEIIAQKYPGSSKLLSSILSKKYLNEEANAVGSNLIAVKKPKIVEKKKEKEIEEPVEFVEDEHLKELEDLVCKNCKRMDVSSRNRLVECSDCHSLYHQECHQPPITETDATDQENWYCSACKEKTISKASSTNSSPAKSSSSSSSYTKNYESSSSSSKKSKEKSLEKPIIPPPTIPATATTTTTVTPSINIVSADKRIQNMKKKAAQRKHK